jgi:hypothetical protein
MKKKLNAQMSLKDHNNIIEQFNYPTSSMGFNPT